MEPLISICMTNYNYEKFIKEAIESVLAQSYTNFELIICDNASTDNSINIIKEFDDKRIRFSQNKENISLYKNENQMLKQANGELLAILHSDDKYDKDFLKEIVEYYNNNREKKVFVTGVYFYHSNENKLIPWKPYETEGIKTQKEILINLAIKNNIGNGVNVVFHKDCLQKSGYINENYKYAADYDYWFKLAEEFEFVYIDKLLAYYRIHESNLSHIVNRNLEMFTEGVEIYEKNIKNSKHIDKKLLKKIEKIELEGTIHKAFYQSIKYKTGAILRNMLKYSLKNKNKWNKGIYIYLMSLYSYFLQENLPGFLFDIFKNLGKSILYPHKLYVNNKIRRLLSDNINTIEDLLQENSSNTAKQ